MTARLGLRLLALVLPVALLAPAAAHADEVVTDDPAADAVRVEDEERILPAPDNTTADVLRTRVDHDESRLRVSIDLRELGSARLYFAVLQVRTPAGTFEVEASDLGRRPRVEIIRRGRAVECRRLRVRTDRADARVHVTVPSSCLGSPRWVQLGVGVASGEKVVSAEGAEQVVVFADDAHRAGTIGDENLTKGPRVRRG